MAMATVEVEVRMVAPLRLRGVLGQVPHRMEKLLELELVAPWSLLEWGRSAGLGGLSALAVARALAQYQPDM